MEHQKARLVKGRQRKAPQPQDERPNLVKIRLLPGLMQLGGKNVLVIQRAGALHQGLAGKGTSGEVGSQGQLPGGLLGVKLPLAVDDDDPKAAAQAAWILPQQPQKLQKGAVRAEFVHMDRKDQTLFPAVCRKLPGGQFLRRQVLQRKLQPALQPPAAAGAHQIQLFLHHWSNSLSILWVWARRVMSAPQSSSRRSSRPCGVKRLTQPK